ncbi:MAG: ATPase [Anaerolineae bacterium]|nr:ATPase [Anaerolineae bacterium]
MTQYFLGVDIGNTKSHALISDDTGAAVGFASGAPGNHEVLGVEGFRSALHEVVTAALAGAGLQRADLGGAGYGIAGYDWPSDRPLIDEVIATLAIDAPYEAANDSIIGLVAGARRGWGVNITAGTSSNCRGRDQHGREGRVSGNGGFFGEYGGGIELVYKAMEAISRAWSQRAPATLLSDLFVEHAGASGVEDLLEGIARGRYHVRATDAPIVFAAVDRGDAVACHLLEWISRELGNQAIGIIRQLGIEALEFEVVLSGSFYKGSPLIAAYIQDEIHRVAPRAGLVRLDAPPVVGGALLGMAATGQDFTRVREQLIASTARFISAVEKV